MRFKSKWTAPRDLDPQVLKLCRVINGMPGLKTRGSCGGHEGGSYPPDSWFVTVDLDLEEDRRPSLEGWLSLEFLSWVIRDLGQDRSVLLDPTARPPYLNRPGRALTFAIEGERGADSGIEPDEVADRLHQLADYYVGVEGLAAYDDPGGSTP